jgi:uncharacterized protein (TIGR03437 family)
MIDVGESAISALSCDPDPNSAGSLACTVVLAQAAVLDTVVTLQVDSSRMQIPAQIQIPAGAVSAQFAASVAASDQDQQFQLSASMQGATRSVALPVLGIRPTRLSCFPLAVHAGDSFTCAVRLSASNVPAVVRLDVSSGNAGLKLPTSIDTRPGQTDLSFVVRTDALAKQQAAGVVVSFGQTQVGSILILMAGLKPILSLPGQQYIRFGSPVAFTVSAADPSDLPLTLSVANLPPGAAFDATSGNFSWTPEESQQGTYTVSFTSANSVGGSSSGDVVIQVDSGKPVLAEVRNGATRTSPNACSPGSVGTLAGRWLSAANPAATDPTGGSLQLGGAQVNINGTYAPVLSASATRIDFVCPAADPGTVLNISVESATGTTNPVQTTMQPFALGVFSADGSGQGQGMVTLSGTPLLATARTYLNTGQPAEPGDSITILATGIGSIGSLLPRIKIGDFSATADSVPVIAAMAGVYQIVAKVPTGVPPGDSWPLLVEMTMPDGSVVQSNTVTIAVETGRQ